MQMGKYEVNFSAELVIGYGYQGRAGYSWIDDAGDTLATYTVFDRYCATDIEAIAHAESQFALRVRDGTVNETPPAVQQR